jgi:hypothetical protein
MYVNIDTYVCMYGNKSVFSGFANTYFAHTKTLELSMQKKKVELTLNKKDLFLFLPIHTYIYIHT